MKGTGKIYWNEDNTRWQDFYVQLGASVSAEFKNIGIQLWGKNLTGTRYHTFYSCLWATNSCNAVNRGR